MTDLKEIKILDIKINALTKVEVLDLIKNLLSDPNAEQKHLVTTNPEFIMAAQTDEKFKNIINNSWLSVADGYGIILASKYQNLLSSSSSMLSSPPAMPFRQAERGSRQLLAELFIGLQVVWYGLTRNNKKLNIVSETITGTDLIPEICQLLSVITTSSFVIPTKVGIQKKIFLLGGYGDTPKLTADALLNPPPYEGGASREAEGEVKNTIQIEYSPFESENIIEKINSFQPLVLFVALNHPRAQKWINANLEKMPSVKLAIGVGGAFDYLSGKIKRAPQNLFGFEWLYRLITQPRRWKRIYTAVIKFPWAVFKNS